MLKTVREAVDVLVRMGQSVDEEGLSKIVKFLREYPDKLNDFCREVRDASDASNHHTPYRRISLVLRKALEKVK